MAGGTNEPTRIILPCVFLLALSPRANLSSVTLRVSHVNELSRRVSGRLNYNGFIGATCNFASSRQTAALTDTTARLFVRCEEILWHHAAAAVKPLRVNRNRNVPPQGSHLLLLGLLFMPALKRHLLFVMRQIIDKSQCMHTSWHNFDFYEFDEIDYRNISIITGVYKLISCFLLSAPCSLKFRIDCAKSARKISIPRRDSVSFSMTSGCPCRPAERGGILASSKRR